MKKGFIIIASAIFFAGCGSGDTKSGDVKPTDTTSAAPAPAEAVDPLAAEGMALVAKSDCLTCHKLSETAIGPAYKDVAIKYKGQPEMIDSLANKVIKGGSGVWGAVAMSPHSTLSKEDAKTMIHFVLSVK